MQRGVGDKAVNQLEKLVNSKLEATVARTIQAQFQTSGKQALQVCKFIILFSIARHISTLSTRIFFIKRG